MDCVSESDVEEILISVLERRYHRTSEESVACGNKSPRTYSAYCQPDMENQLFFSCSQMSANIPRGGTLGISGWGCAAGTLEPLAYTRAIYSCNPKGSGAAWHR